MTYLEVAVDAPLFQPLTYSFPPAMPLPAPGSRVLVPLGRRTVTAYVLAVTDRAPDLPAARIKTVREVLDCQPLVPASMIPFLRWISDYYHYPPGEVFKTALPAGLSPRSRTILLLTEQGKIDFPGDEELPDQLKPFADTLRAKKRLSPTGLKQMEKERELRRSLKQWLAAGWVKRAELSARDRVRIKVEEMVELLVPHQEETSGLKPSERKTLAVLSELVDEHGNRLVPRRQVTGKYRGAGRALAGLQEKGQVRLLRRRVVRDPRIPASQAAIDQVPEQLTAEQEQVVCRIGNAMDAGAYAAFLLHGVTGSGKTEVYIRAAEKALAMGKTVMVLVPEIALSLQVEAQFIARFGNTVALLHSGLSSGERYDQWNAALKGTARIVIGARSAVFAPLKDLGLVIVDEEHDAAYKQDDGLRYSGRDVAVMRASREDAVVVLGSATPSVVSFYNTTIGKYTLLTMKNRVRQRSMPGTQIVDLRKVPTLSGRPPIFSPQLIKALKKAVGAGEQALLLLNRRGLARMKICAACGAPLQCRNCHVSLTVHRGKKGAMCHYCGFTMRGEGICGSCASTRFYDVGFGTQRLEEELKTMFPHAVVARLDRDVAGNRKAFRKILGDMRQQKIDILLGTQMVAKGHHFPGITMVGVVLADTGLGMPDFRAGERTFQLLSQVTGRAGRGDKAGQVVIQTFRPEHYSVHFATSHDYSSFYNRELTLRKSLGFPPFGRMVSFLLSGRDEKKVEKAAAALHGAARKTVVALCVNAGVLRLLGPSPAPLSRLQERYRWQMVALGRDAGMMHRLCRSLREKAAEVCGSGVALAIDVDPENML